MDISGSGYGWDHTSGGEAFYNVDGLGIHYDGKTTREETILGS